MEKDKSVSIQTARKLNWCHKHRCDASICLATFRFWIYLFILMKMFQMHANERLWKIYGLSRTWICMHLNDFDDNCIRCYTSSSHAYAIDSNTNWNITFFISGNLCCVLASAFVENRNRDFVVIVRLAKGSHSNSIDKLHLIPLSVSWDAGNQIILL